MDAFHVFAYGMPMSNATLSEGDAVKVFLDDERTAPDGWVHVRWPDEAIALLHTGKVTEMSLYHDLGNDDRGTGYDVVLWIEEAVITRSFALPEMAVHSANASARLKMEAGIRSIVEHVSRTAAARER